MTTPARPPKLYPIPAMQQPQYCKGCGATVYWIRTENDRPMPCTVALEGCKAPTLTEDGMGASHHIDCPKAGQFRRKK